VAALSLGGLRRRIEAALLPDAPLVVLQLDRAARLERGRRRRGGARQPAGAPTLSSGNPDIEPTSPNDRV
jgi:hypothetical protein